eukprot:gb/GEZN01014364.1/.p1 GENE.gb/GEZN01014364.1/~~gb/GEZN01014364.1/.p1  ORF type:complete len:138 (-),score=14.25 gb/GEZN01014364.1/:422-835(-)
MFKLNAGVDFVVKNVISNLGSPFTDKIPEVKQYTTKSLQELLAMGLIASETVVPGLIMIGCLTRLCSLVMVVMFSIATYAHLVLWKGEIETVIYNQSNIHGAAVFLAGYALLLLFGAGSFSFDGLLCTPKSKKKKSL